VFCVEPPHNNTNHLKAVSAILSVFNLKLKTFNLKLPLALVELRIPIAPEPALEKKKPPQVCDKGSG